MDILEEQEPVLREIERRMAVMRALRDQLLDPAPPLPPHNGRAEFRRTAARLRAGEIESAVEGLSSEDLAAVLEDSVYQDEILSALLKEARDLDKLMSAWLGRLESKLHEDCEEIFHEAKKLARNAGPDSPIVEHVRRMDSAWRKEKPRTRGRKGKKREG